MALPPVILEYQFSTFTAQLQVSTATAEATGRISLSVSSGGTPKYCSQIQVAVPIGTGATDFSAATPTAAVNTANWTLSSQAIVSGSDLGLDTDASYASFTFDAKDSSVYKIDYNLVLSLTGVVNEAVGTFGVVVGETSGTDSSSLTPKRSTFPLDKMPPYFYLENFVATTTASPLVPATEFANGAEIRLAWESNGTWFQVYEKGNATPIYSGVEKTFNVKSGAATDTTYFLQASVTGDPSGDSGGFEPIYLYDSLTVTISNPDLAPKSAAVADDASVGGTLAVKGDTTLANAAVGGTLGVTGDTTVKNATVGGTLAVTGAATLASTLEAKGATTLAAATASSLSVSGAATLAQLVASSALTATSSVVSMLGAATALTGNKTYTAKTDGFVAGNVGAASDPSKISAAIITGSSGGVTVQATGGNHVFWLETNMKSGYEGSNANSFLLPVRKGLQFSVTTANFSVNQVNPPVSFFWIPVGVATAPSFEEVRDCKPKAVRKPRALEDCDTPRPDSDVDPLVEIIDEILGDAMTRRQKRRLRRALVKLL